MKVRFQRLTALDGPPLAERNLSVIPQAGEVLLLNDETWHVWSVAWDLDARPAYVVVALVTRREFSIRMRSSLTPDR